MLITLMSAMEIHIFYISLCLTLAFIMFEPIFERISLIYSCIQCSVIYFSFSKWQKLVNISVALSTSETLHCIFHSKRAEKLSTYRV